MPASIPESPPPLTGALAGVLRGGRADFNQRFRRARYRDRRLSAASFSGILRDVVAPLAEAVAAQAPGQLEAVVSALYDGCLQLVGLELLGPGARLPVMEEVFTRLLPAAVPLLAQDPERVVASLANAVYNLAMEPSADAARWIEIMTAAARQVRAVEAWLAAGQAAAWVCGLAHFRPRVLETIATTRPPWLPLVLGLAQEAPATTDDLRLDDADQGIDWPRRLADLADPWWRPGRPAEADRSLQLVARAGGFLGFGGPFASPPEVVGDGDRIYARDEQNVWQLFADAFGVMLRRHGGAWPAAPDETASPFRLDRQGQIRHGALRVRLPQLAGWTSRAASAHTLAVALPHSHFLYLVARR